MILEHALLPVRPERADDFEAAFAEARPIISAMPGFRLLHHFYDPFPVVQHFVTVVSDATPGTPPAVTASTPNQQ
jgi:heme-degrading monooxygenase HmoA